MNIDPDSPQFANDDEAFLAALADSNDMPEDQPQEGQPPGDDPAQDDQGPVDEGGVDTAADPQQPDPDDEIVASLPEAVRAYVEGLRNRASEIESKNQSLSSELAKTRNDYASMAGKLPHLQRKLAEYETREKQAPPQTPQPAALPPATEGQGAPEETLEAYLQSAEWKEYAATFPTDAALWERGQRLAIKAAERIAQQTAQRATQEFAGRIEKFEPVIHDLTQQRAKAAMAEAINDLASEHPDWQQIDSDPRFENWFDTQWLPSQLDVVQSAFADKAYANRKLSDPSFVKKILHEFKDAHGITRSKPAAEAPATTPSARLALAAAPSIRSAPPVRRSVEAMTPDQAFQAGLNSDD